MLPQDDHSLNANDQIAQAQKDMLGSHSGWQKAIDDQANTVALIQNNPDGSITLIRREANEQVSIVDGVTRQNLDDVFGPTLKAVTQAEFNDTLYNTWKYTPEPMEDEPLAQEVSGRTETKVNDGLNLDGSKMTETEMRNAGYTEDEILETLDKRGDADTYVGPSKPEAMSEDELRSTGRYSEEDIKAFVTANGQEYKGPASE